MTHPNAALLRRGKEAFLRGDIESASELLADDIVILRTRSPAEPRVTTQLRIGRR